ncbi:tyrosine-type recombinase/integrase [Herbidospora sp. NBRC 101105]|uniref:site-specific integrase n=1 Tax=Herbidospora sp. NBRC 101105 TaxID=3032195 RepID=UPI0024A3409A|nr:tyrosine-type recombinase/integrase [Herbidospora sp. NBRC 101105]GLX94835.1 site-specific integrase [Herbidospora sp. NBRC 101105]
MTARRSKGDGSLYWDESRQRWVATITVGYTPAGKRIVRKATGKTKTEAKTKLKELIRDYEDGLTTSGNDHTVAQVVGDWLAYGLSGREESTVTNRRILAEQHVISALGARKLRELSADDVDRWLAAKAKTLSTETLRKIHSILKRSIARAQARDKVKRNVVLLCDIPKGKEGRPSKSLTLDQAVSILRAAENTNLYAYLVASLLLGARTEELRALTWSHVDLDAEPPSIMVWRSVRVGGDTKTQKSRRTLALPRLCVDALRLHKDRQAVAKEKAGGHWQENDLVFASRHGTELDAGNVRRAFRVVLKRTDLNPEEWTPRELRHSFVSLMSDAGVAVEDIARLVGHKGTVVTEKVYRKQLRPVLLEGAEAMDRIFGDYTQQA